MLVITFMHVELAHWITAASAADWLAGHVLLKT